MEFAGRIHQQIPVVWDCAVRKRTEGIGTAGGRRSEDWHETECHGQGVGRTAWQPGECIRIQRIGVDEGFGYAQAEHERWNL